MKIGHHWICILLILNGSIVWNYSYCQTTANLVPPSNVNYSGLEKNILFYANNRYQVTQTGSVQLLNLPALFDGKYTPCYTSQALDSSHPTINTISNLPNIHTQNGAYVGWSTRGYPSKRFKIEGYNSYGSSPGWVTVADVNNNTSYNYIVKLPAGSYTQIKYTFYEGRSSAGGKLGVSELFFLHNEAAQAYDALLIKYQPNGNVLIGKTSQTNSSYKLDVNGNIRANKIVVNTTGADYVFDSSYYLQPIDSIYNYIKLNHHLPGMISARQMQKNGLNLEAACTKLLAKAEELTLYIIELNKRMSLKDEEIAQLREVNSSLINIRERLDKFERNHKK